MREDEALLKAIIANPDEDTPRLALADWLDENQPDKGPTPASSPSARAEFIRVQCRLAEMAPDDPEYTDLLDREHDLQLWLDRGREKKRKLSAPLQRDDDEYHRGFVRDAAAEYGAGHRGAVMKLCSALRKAATNITIDTLRLYAYTGAQMAEFLRDPAVTILRRLYLQPTGGDDGDFFDIDDDMAEYVERPEEGAAEAIARALAESPHVTHLRDLRLFFPLTSDAAKILTGAKHLDGLTHLTVEPESPEAIRVLGRAKWFRNLRFLRLQERLGDAVLTAFAALPPFPNLRGLDLGSNAFSATGLARFAASKSFPALVELDLAGTSLDQGAVAALVRGKWRLAVLNLRGCGFGNRGAELLAASRLLEGVRVCDLSVNGIGPRGMKALAESPHVASVRHLSLEYNPLGKGGLMALARSPHLRGLTGLSLGYARGDRPSYKTADVAAFLAALDMPNLRHLSLEGLPTGTAGARAIAASGMRLTRLELRYGGIGDRGLAALVAAPALAGLLKAGFVGCRLKDGAEALADRKVWPLLSWGSLYSNPIPKNIARRLKVRRGISVDT